MNARRFMPALFAALAISIVCTVVLGRKITAHEGARPASLRYVAAAMSIAPGEILKANEVDYVDWPASQPLEGAFTKTEDVIGRPVLYPLEKGQMILSHLLAAPGAGFGLTTRIPAGMRAIALKSDEVVGVAGFLFPGSRVDVLVTYHSNQNPEPITATVLQDSQVVAVGHQIQPDPNGKPASVDVITIIAKPDDAEKVVLASTQGTIHFVLRNATDRAEASDPPVNLSQFAGGPSVRAAAARKDVAEKPKPYVVETILGDKETSTSFWPVRDRANQSQ
jgi:pilus assembly protein CpaB